MTFAADRLKSLVERIEKLREEKKLLTSDERDLFTEAKSAGFDGKALRKVLQRRAMDDSERESLDQIVDLYEHALGAKAVAAQMVASGASVREAAQATGLKRSTVHRAVSHKTHTEGQETPTVPQAVAAAPDSSISRAVPRQAAVADQGDSSTIWNPASDPPDLTPPSFLKRDISRATA